MIICVAICLCILTGLIRSEYLPILISIISAVLIHELGHLTAAKLLGARVLSVKASPLGMRIKYSQLSLSPLSECIMCAAGSLTGIICSLIVLIPVLSECDNVIRFSVFSLGFSIANMLPIRGLDGGSIAEIILNSLLYPEKAEKILYGISSVTTLLFYVLAVRIQLRIGINLPMIILSIYLVLSTIKGK